MPIIVTWKYPRLRVGDFAADLILADFRSIVLLIKNIAEKETKIATFAELGASTPLYEEKSTMVESITATIVKVTIKINAVLLFRVIRVKLIILPFMLW